MNEFRLPPIGAHTIGIVQAEGSPKYLGDYYGAMTEQAAEDLADRLTAKKKGLTYTRMAYSSLVKSWRRLLNDVAHVPGRIISSAVLCNKTNRVWKAPRDYDRFWTLDVVYGDAEAQTQDHYSHAAVFASNALPADGDYEACFLTSDAVVMPRDRAAYHAKVYTSQLPAASGIMSLVSEVMTADAWRILEGWDRP